MNKQPPTFWMYLSILVAIILGIFLPSIYQSASSQTHYHEEDFELERFDLYGSLRLDSNYIYRAISLSDEDLATSASVEITHSSPLYADIRIGSVDQADGELRVRAGAKEAYRQILPLREFGQATDLYFDFGIEGFLYQGADKLENRYEAYGSARYHADWADIGVEIAFDDEADEFFRIDLNRRVSDHFHINPVLGSANFSRLDIDRYYYSSIYLRYLANPFVFKAEYSYNFDSDLDSQWALSGIYRF